MSSVLDQTELVVKRRPKVFETRAGYDVYDQGATTVIGSVEQIGRDNVEKLVRPERADNARTPLELSDSSGQLLLMTHIQAFHSSLVVDRPDGTAVGLIQLQNVFGKSRFTLEVAETSVGSIAARTWRKKSFAVVDDQGAEVASVDMTHGNSGDLSHDNHYAVHIDPRLGDPVRALAFAAVVAVDMILWTR